MKPAPFAYASPVTVAAALDALAADGDAKVIAGGQSLLPLLNLRMARPSLLVDIGRLTELDRVIPDGDRLLIGALTRHTRLEQDPDIARRQPLLRAAATHIGHRAIRNHGTVGGSIAHADPAAELPAVLLALDGHVVVESVRGRREIAAGDLFQTYFETRLEPGELLTWVVVPALAPGCGWGFHEFATRPGDFAQAGAIAIVDGEAGLVTAARLTLFAVGPTPVRVNLDGLVGCRLDAPATDGPVDAAIDASGLSGERRRLVAAVAARAVDEALARATPPPPGSDLPS